MFIFLAPPNFGDFTQDPDVQDCLEILKSVGTSDESVNSHLSTILYNLLKDVYELGDITRIGGSNFNIMFCMEYEGDELILQYEALEACFEKLSDFSENIVSPVITLLLPNFREEGDLDAFTEDFAELYRDSEIQRSLAVMTTGFVRDQLGVKIGH